MVHELGENLASILCVGQNFPLGNYASSWHNTPLLIQVVRNSPALDMSDRHPALLLCNAIPPRRQRREYYDFGRLAPYLERPCLRSATPEVSRLPRTV